MKKLFLIFSFICFFTPNIFSATLYMGPEETHTNLQAAMGAMTAGDTLIIRDGTYTGSTNTITSLLYPPTSSSLWTTIKAENNGKVFFGDPDTTTDHGMFSFSGTTTNCHWIFEGLVWYSGTFLGSATHVKFLRCGAGSNIVSVGNFAMWQTTANSYILYEDCHAWGGGRYMFNAYLSDHIVFRRCVGRTDAVDTLHDGTKTEPIGGFSIYGSSYCEVQNCIMIDTDSIDYWVYESLPGAFTCPNGTGSNNRFIGCIALKGDMPAGGCTSGMSAITRDNTIHWDMDNGTIYGGTNTFSHMTIGVIKNAGINIGGINAYASTASAANSIFYDLDGDLGAVYNVTSDYNYFYANSTNFTGGSSAGAHDVLDVDPTAGSLEYLLQIESGSDLAGKASDGGNIGATVMKKIGTSGTLWGESGYATEQTGDDSDLWPFPNEDIIKTNFASYDHANVSGTRGFCADTVNPRTDTGKITLTSYIWEYLGNTGATAGLYGVTTGGSATFGTATINSITWE